MLSSVGMVCGAAGVWVVSSRSVIMGTLGSDAGVVGVSTVGTLGGDTGGCRGRVTFCRISVICRIASVRESPSGATGDLDVGCFKAVRISCKAVRIRVLEELSGTFTLEGNHCTVSHI